MACAVFATARARAADLPGATLDVTRGVGAETCPDTDTLAAELSRRIAPGTPPVAPLALRVTLERDGDGYTAKVDAAGRKSGERLLRAVGPSCEVIHDALVVTLLVLLDEEHALIEALPSEPPTTATAPATAPPPALVLPAPREESKAPVPEQPATRRARPALFVAAGGGVTYGLPVDWSGAVLFDLAVRVGWIELSAGGFWGPSRTIAARPGEVAVNAFGERTRACYAATLARARGLRLLGCAEGALAKLTGEGRGFEGSHPETRPWWLAGGAVEATYPLNARLDVGFSLSALGTVHTEVFSVKGLPHPDVYRTHAVVGVAAMRLEARLF